MEVSRGSHPPPRVSQARPQAFDKALTELVDSGKLSSSRIKGVTDLAMQNVKVRSVVQEVCSHPARPQNDAHLASSLFRTHKRAKPANKLWALYVLDAIARECRSQVRRTAKSQDAGNNSPGPAADGTPGGFLAKVETFLERMIDESWERGLPDHKVRVSLPACMLPRRFRLMILISMLM
jgi:hypothetical protein